MNFFANYGLFLLKTLTLVVAILIVVGGIFSLSRKNQTPTTGKLKIKHLNKKLHEDAEQLHEAIDDKKTLKAWRKTQKNLKPAEKKIFVLDFVGDIRAQAVESLRETISALLTVVTPADEVVVRLESAGGMVHAYGLAAAQLARLREKQIPLTVCIDKVAASGGYMMAVVANRIIAAPFAIIGSVGVVAQLPNFHRLMDANKIDFEQLTAGEYKRTLTMLGKNTAEGRAKFQEQIDQTHLLFKTHIQTYRAHLNVNAIATGEHWFAIETLERQMVDELRISDDYLQARCQEAEIYEVSYVARKSKLAKLMGSAQGAVTHAQDYFSALNQTIRY